LARGQCPVHAGANVFVKQQASNKLRPRQQPMRPVVGLTRVVRCGDLITSVALLDNMTSLLLGFRLLADFATDGEFAFARESIAYNLLLTPN
jgi:hypothetical protein